MTKEEFDKLVVGDTVYYNNHPRIYKGIVTTLDLNTKKNSLYALYVALGKDGTEVKYSAPLHYFKQHFKITNNGIPVNDEDDSICYHCKKRHCVNYGQPGMSECDMFEPNK